MRFRGSFEQGMNLKPNATSADPGVKTNTANALGSPILKVENLETTFELKSGPFRAVNGVSFDIHKGETLGVVGESGCGKSVTSFSVMGLIEHPGRVTQGRVFFEGQDLLKLPENQMQKIRGGKIAMIFQEPMTALNPVLTVGRQIDEQILRHENVTTEEAKERSIQMLKKVGIPTPGDRYASYPHQLSGGMRQRAMIAMALSCDPDVLIADEPTTALDVTIQAQILELFQALQQEKKMAVQFITHDLGVISEVSDRVMVMYAGLKCEEASSATLFNSPRHPYTAALIESRPRLGQRDARLRTIEGSVPAPHELPPGCPFQNRCPRATAHCLQRPPEIEIQPGHRVACFNPL